MFNVFIFVFLPLILLNGKQAFQESPHFRSGGYINVNVFIILHKYIKMFIRMVGTSLTQNFFLLECHKLFHQIFTPEETTLGSIERIVYTKIPF